MRQPYAICPCGRSVHVQGRTLCSICLALSRRSVKRPAVCQCRCGAQVRTVGQIRCWRCRQGGIKGQGVRPRLSPSDPAHAERDREWDKWLEHLSELVLARQPLPARPE